MASHERPTRIAFLNAVRYFNKFIFNHFTLWFAKRGIGGISILNHRGRKSGRPYTTPVLATYTDENIYIPLSYGEKVDWLRNVLAQEDVQITHKGRSYTAINPIILESQKVFAELPMNRRELFERFKMEKFLRLTITNEK